MTTTNVGDLKSHLSHYLRLVADGEPVQVCKRNVAIAQIVPVASRVANRTVLGCGAGSVVIKADLTEPAMESCDWNMLGGEG